MAGFSTIITHNDKWLYCIVLCVYLLDARLELALVLQLQGERDNPILDLHNTA